MKPRLKVNRKSLSIPPNLQTNFIQKPKHETDQYTGGKWFIHDPKHYKDN